MSSNPYDLLADYFDDIYPHDEYAKKMSPVRDKIEKEFYDKEKIKLLDLACGTGRSLSLFHSDRFTLIGVDNSSLMIEKARRNLNDLGIGVELKRKDILKLNELELQPQDCVTMFGASISLFNESQRDKLITDIYSILNEQGIFVLDIAEFSKGCQEVYNIIKPGISYSPIAKYNDCEILQFKKIIKQGKRNIIIFYHYFYFENYFRQIHYVIETEFGQHKKTIYAPVTGYYIESIDTELQKHGFKNIDPITTRYHLTDCIIAKKS